MNLPYRESESTPIWCRAGVHVVRGMLDVRGVIMQTRLLVEEVRKHTYVAHPTYKYMVQCYVLEDDGTGDWFFAEELSRYVCPCTGDSGGECARCEHDCCDECAEDHGDGGHTDEGETYYKAHWLHHDPACAAYLEEE